VGSRQRFILKYEATPRGAVDDSEHSYVTAAVVLKDFI
jgi:hypothetical protein